MASGNVKWFNNAKGYGFILPEGGGEDLFAHYSSIQMDGYKTLKAGQAVEFDVQEGPKGLHAVNIRLPESARVEVDPIETEDALEGTLEDGVADDTHADYSAGLEPASASGEASS